MLTREKLLTFTDWEDMQYTRQVTLLQNRLLGAADALDLYSCHSQPHVLEVMEQCGMLLSAFAPWLKERLPGVSTAWMHDHLLLSAKLHDIGMGGTESLRQLLSATDGLYALISSGTAETALATPFLRVLQQEGPRSGMTTGTWQEVLRLSAAPAGATGPLQHSLARCHEDIKSSIRKQHAANSARCILSQADEFSAHYGPEVDMVTVAALAALHSSSSLDDANIVPDGPHYERIRQHIHALVTECRPTAEADRIVAHESFQRIVALAALLRLADARRSGSRLMNMDQARILCEVDRNGHLSLYKLKNGVRDPISQRLAFDILAGEALTEFGPVTAHPNADGSWHIRHEMTLRSARFPEIRDVFANMRLRSYAEEIDTGALVYSQGFTHEIFLHLEGCPPFAAASVAKQWRREVSWLKDSPLQIRTL